MTGQRSPSATPARKRLCESFLAERLLQPQLERQHVFLHVNGRVEAGDRDVTLNPFGIILLYQDIAVLQVRFVEVLLTGV